MVIFQKSSSIPDFKEAPAFVAPLVGSLVMISVYHLINLICYKPYFFGEQKPYEFITYETKMTQNASENIWSF